MDEHTHDEARQAIRELRDALSLILENPDHDLLDVERETAEEAIQRASEVLR